MKQRLNIKIANKIPIIADHNHLIQTDTSWKLGLLAFFQNDTTIIGYSTTIRLQTKCS
jgi:hypothetical protein